MRRRTGAKKRGVVADPPADLVDDILRREDSDASRAKDSQIEVAQCVAPGYKPVPVLPSTDWGAVGRDLKIIADDFKQRHGVPSSLTVSCFDESMFEAEGTWPRDGV